MASRAKPPAPIRAKRAWRGICSSLFATLVFTSGCLSTKGDIRLLQDELKLTRSQVGLVDTSVLRSTQQLQRQIANLSATVDRLSDSTRMLAQRLAAFQASTTGNLSTMNEQIVQMQALLGQNTRNLQETRAQLNALREQSVTMAPPPAGGTMPPMGDTSRRIPPGLPGPATLMENGRQALSNGAYGTARNVFDQLLNAYPTASEAPGAQYYIGEAFRQEGNLAAADSVYQVLVSRYPKSDDAANALYKHGRYLWETNHKPEARAALNKVISDYPGSDGAALARTFLRENR